VKIYLEVNEEIFVEDVVGDDGRRVTDDGHQGISQAHLCVCDLPISQTIKEDMNVSDKFKEKFKDHIQSHC
jgi:hypothetical protein